MPNPDDKRPGIKDYRTLFDIKPAANGEPSPAWHAKTLWNCLSKHSPKLLLEFHSETRVKADGEGRNRVYVVAEDVHKTLEHGKVARDVAMEIDALPRGGCPYIMDKGGLSESTLMYQAPRQWDTISVGHTCHIQHGFERNAETSIQALLRLANMPLT